MPSLTGSLVLDRCPHCSVANPNLSHLTNFDTDNHTRNNPRKWAAYCCGRCGGVVTAWARGMNAVVQDYFPGSGQVNNDIPERPRNFLSQAQDSLHAPAGAVMLAASAVDSMLKLKGYLEGSLYTRIEKAVGENVITKDMATWAHEVRLDANDQRHADEESNLPTELDAKRVLDFATALAELLFVLPSRVQRGISSPIE